MGAQSNYIFFTVLFWTLSIIFALLYFFFEKYNYLSGFTVPILFYVAISLTMCILLAWFDRSVIRLDEREAQHVSDRIASLKADRLALQSKKLHEISSFSED